MKRVVFHLGGYDFTPPEAAHRRFVRELKRFSKTWTIDAFATAPVVGSDEVVWRVNARGPNWTSEVDYHLIRWDDVIASAARRPNWQRIPLGLLALGDFVIDGAPRKFARASPLYAAFFFYPVLVLLAFAAISLATGFGAAETTASGTFGVVVSFVTFAFLVTWPGRRIALLKVLDDWIFSRAYLRNDQPELNARLDRLAQKIVLTTQTHLGEILVVGHSLGAVLAVDLIARVLRLRPMIGNDPDRIVFLSVGSSILKIGLHQGGGRLRSDLQQIAAARGVLWAEYQALVDVMNFYHTNPMQIMGLTPDDKPKIRSSPISFMVEPEYYRRIRYNFLRLHCQFVSANTRRTYYDYFMFVCGPIGARQQVYNENGAADFIADDGALVAHTSSIDAPQKIAV